MALRVRADGILVVLLHTTWLDGLARLVLVGGDGVAIGPTFLSRGRFGLFDIARVDLLSRRRNLILTELKVIGRSFVVEHRQTHNHQCSNDSQHREL